MIFGLTTRHKIPLLCITLTDIIRFRGSTRLACSPPFIGRQYETEMGSYKIMERLQLWRLVFRIEENWILLKRILSLRSI